jgi:hypothetical protein
MVCDGTGIAREESLGEGKLGMRDCTSSPKEFLTNANANQNLCIALTVNGQHASPPEPTGEGLREGLQ